MFEVYFWLTAPLIVALATVKAWQGIQRVLEWRELAALPPRKRAKVKAGAEEVETAKSDTGFHIPLSFQHKSGFGVHTRVHIPWGKGWDNDEEETA